MIENRPTPNLMADDDALWFPAHMTGGDSFLRVTRPDGAPEEDDGIGLPNREPPKRGGGGRPPKKGGFKASNWLWITLWGVTAIGIVTVAARKEIAAEIMQGWLKGQGVVSKVKFDKLSLHDASGTILIGDAAHPDVSVERFDADYSLNLFAGHGQPLFRLNSLHAVHPLVAMVLKDGRLHFGSLDKLVQAALNAPATGAPAPHAIQLDDATLLLQTDYGLVRARGNVALADGQLADLGLRLPASQFSGPAGSGTVSDGIVTAKAIAGDQLEIHAAADVASADIRGGSMVEDAGNRSLHLQNLALALDAHLPYRKGAGGLTALNGALSGTVAARADTVQGQGTAAAGLESNLAFNGELHSTATSIQYEGGARLLARADDLQSGDIDGKGLQLSGPALGLKAGWSTANGVSLAATGALNGDAALLRQGDLMAKSAHLNVTTLSVASDTTGSHGDFTGRLTAGHAAGAGLSLDAATLAITGTARADGDGWAVDAVSDIASDNGSYNGLSALAKSRRDDPKLPKDDSVVALDRALQRFSLRAKGLKASLMAQGSSAPQVDIRLQSPAIANLKGGGTLVLTPQPGAPLLATGRKGAFSIALAGPGLPQAKLTAADIGTDARTGLLSGSYVLSSHLTAAPVTGVAIDNAHGRFTTTRASGFDVTLDAPTAVTVASAELGDHIENVKVTVAQRDGALFRLTPSGWHASALFNTLSLTAPVEGLKVSDGQGSVDVYSQAGSDVLGLKMQLAAATLSDGLPVAQRRFNAMLLTGTLGQDMRRMTGRFTAGTPDLKTKSGGPTPIATIALDNDVVTNAGSLSFATVGLNFAPDGLQPIHLSPQIASVMSRDVSGTATFTGAFDWTKTTTDSHGVLTVDGLNFRGGMGVAQGLSGKIVFTSLAPLRSDPGQRFSLDNLAAIVPLSHFFRVGAVPRRSHCRRGRRGDDAGRQGSAGSDLDPAR